MYLIVEIDLNSNPSFDSFKFLDLCQCMCRFGDCIHNRNSLRFKERGWADYNATVQYIETEEFTSISVYVNAAELALRGGRTRLPRFPFRCSRTSACRGHLLLLQVRESRFDIHIRHHTHQPRMDLKAMVFDIPPKLLVLVCHLALTATR